MLTEKEKHGISELLYRMSPKELASLAQTVTSRLILPETATEAISAILLNTDRPADVLRRRKVTKEFLLKYLSAKRVPIDSGIDKSSVVSAVLQLWGSSPSSALLGILEEDSVPEAPAPSRNTSYSSLSSLDFNGSPSHGGGGAGAPGLGSGSLLLRNVLGSLPINSSDEHSWFDSSLPRSDSSHSLTKMDDGDYEDGGIDLVCLHEDDDRLPPLSSSFQPRSSVLGRLSQSLTPSLPLSSSCSSTPPSTLLLSSSAPSSYSSFFNRHWIGPSMSPPSPNGSPTTWGFEQHRDTEFEAYEMADRFVRWFYELLNATFYGRGSDASEFGPQHFWVDASSKIQLQSSSPCSAKDGSDIESICVQGDGRRVCDALKHVVQKYRVTYNPNTSRDGVSGNVDAHGLAVVTACGTLHNPSNSIVCGTFHQQFGLVRDPNLGNNWKIKFTNANLVSKDTVSEIPSLSHSVSSSSSSAVSLS